MSSPSVNFKFRRCFSLSILLLLLLLHLNMAKGRPGSEVVLERSPSTPEEDPDGDDDAFLLQEAMNRLKERISDQFGAIRMTPSSSSHQSQQQMMNISRLEVVSTYGEYMKRIRARKELEESDKSLFLAKKRRKNSKIYTHTFFANATNNDVITTFQFPLSDLPGRDLFLQNEGLRIRQAVLVLPEGCQHLDLNSTEDMTPNVTSWLFQETSSPFVVGASCYPHQGRMVASLEIVVSAPAAAHSRVKRRTPLEAGDFLLRESLRKAGGRGRKKGVRGRKVDCERVRHEHKREVCCRKQMNIDLADLDPDIIQPRSLNIYVCAGRCNGRRHEFASNHALIQFLVHRKYGKKVPRICCTPTKLKGIEVIRKVGSSLNTLYLKDAIAEECSCS